MEISLVPAVPEGSLAALISLSYWISFTFVQMDAVSCQKSKTSSSCWVLPFFYSISPGFLYPRVIEYTLYQSSKYHSINFCLSSVFSSLLQVKHKSFCDPSWSLFFFMFLTVIGIFKSTCYIDVRWFPFDVQRCDLKFGSWTYGGWSLDLQMLEADITSYIANGEWDLVGKRGPVAFKMLKDWYSKVHRKLLLSPHVSEMITSP